MKNFFYFYHAFFVFFIFISKLPSDNSNIMFSGYVDYTYISRLSDRSLIDIPYRMASLNMEKRNDNMSLNGNFTIEYHLRDDAYFLGSSDPQDFIFDMRELYITYYHFVFPYSMMPFYMVYRSSYDQII